MSFVVAVNAGVLSPKSSGYVIKRGGMNSLTGDPNLASRYPTREAAKAGKVGHHRDMGGSGFKGTIMPLTRNTYRYRSV